MSTSASFAPTAEEMTELSGEIIGPDLDAQWVAAHVELVGEGGDARHAEIRADFVLRMDDGREVRVAAEGAELVSPPSSEKRRERWGAVADGWIGRSVPELAAGPHYPVRLQVDGYRVGDRAIIRGTVEERTLVSDPSYRAASTAPTSMRAAVIAPERSAAAAPSASRPRASLDAGDVWTILGVLFCVALVAFATLVLPSPTRVGETFLRGGWIAFGLTNAWLMLARFGGYPHVCPSAPHRHYLPAFYRVIDEPTDKPRRAIPSIEYFLSTVVFMMCMVVFTPADVALGLGYMPASYAPQVYESGIVLLWIPALFAWALVGILLGVWRHRTRASLRMSGSIARAVEHPVAGWSAVLGSVMHPLRRSVTVHLTVLASGGRGKRRLVHMQPSFALPKTVRAETREGLVEMDLDEAWWAPTEWSNESLPPDAPALSGGRGSSEKRLAATQWEMFATSGASVLVAGDLRMEQPLRAPGPESLLVFTTPPGTDARRLLRRALVLHRLTWFLPAVGGLYVLVQLVML